MEYDYSIENLINTFNEHAEIAKSQQEFCNQVFLEQNPDQELPKHMTDSFNIAKAFHAICSEILQLKKSCN